MTLDKIVVGVDFSDESKVAREHAVSLARRFGAEVTLAHAGAMPGFLFAQAAGQQSRDLAVEYMRHAKDELDTLRRETEHCGVTAHARFVDDHADPALVDCAADVEADLLVVGTHGRTGWKRVMLGSIAERAVRLAPCDTLVARGHVKARGYTRVLVPTDFSPTATAAINRAISITNDDGNVELFHSYGMHGYDGVSYSLDPRPVEQELEEQVRASGHREVMRHASARVKVTFNSELAAPVDGIVRRAEESRCDAIVIGSHGHRGWRRWLLGSVAEATVRHAPCAVYVVRAPEQD